MTTETQAKVAAALGINVLALWSSVGNAAFPAPVSKDGDGNILWNTSDITAFAALWTAAKANGWKICTAELPVFNFTFAAANRAGHKRGDLSAAQMSHAPTAA